MGWFYGKNDYDQFCRENYTHTYILSLIYYAIIFAVKVTNKEIICWKFFCCNVTTSAANIGGVKIKKSKKGVRNKFFQLKARNYWTIGADWQVLTAIFRTSFSKNTNIWKQALMYKMVSVLFRFLFPCLHRICIKAV